MNLLISSTMLLISAFGTETEILGSLGTLKEHLILFKDEEEEEEEQEDNVLSCRAGDCKEIIISEIARFWI